MAAPRKVFRIEETAGARAQRRAGVMRAASTPDPASSGEGLPAKTLHAEILEALAALRATMAATAPAAESDGAAPRNAELLGIAAAHLTRVAQELNAVVSGTAQATQKILAGAEEIDQAADNLSAALKGKLEQGAALDIRELVIRIFEACNFQDLIGQRVSKVMATLTLVEHHITGVIESLNDPTRAKKEDAAQYLHGPRLDNDSGHVTQAEIDAILGS
jgi:chemotaxis protein CheZ